MTRSEPENPLTPGSPWVRRVIDESGATVEQPTRSSPSLEASVATIMTRTTYCVRPEVGVHTLATLLLEQRISGLPVVDADGKPVGVVTKTDLLRHLHEQRDLAVAAPDEEAVLARFGAGYHSVPVDGTTVADIMMPMVFALKQDVPIAQAAAVMAAEGIHRLPILDATGAVCGILSALDLVRWIAHEAGLSV